LPSIFDVEGSYIVFAQFFNQTWDVLFHCRYSKPI
jgi:hypothetical protein